MARGTGREYLIERLRSKGRTDLLEQVDAGTLSVHAAAVRARIVKAPGSVAALTSKLAALSKRDRLRLLRQLDPGELVDALPTDVVRVDSPALARTRAQRGYT